MSARRNCYRPQGPKILKQACPAFHLDRAGVGALSSPPVRGTSAFHAGGLVKVSDIKEQGEDTVGRAVRIAQLVDIYGPLLTDRQREFVRLHFEEDLSFGEIARDFEISRQAVHDAVKHAEKALESYDAKLGLSGRPVEFVNRAPVPAAQNAPPQQGQAAPVVGLEPSIEKLNGAIERLQRSGGVLYDVEGLRRELAEVVGTLRSLGSSK